MQAVRVHPAPTGSKEPYSHSNPATSSALHLDSDVPIPQLKAPGELLIRVKASTVIRDMLTWPETYCHEYAIIGNDLAGVVEKVLSEDSKFKPGDEVFGMVHADRASAWAEYVLAKENEIVLKPKALTWEQAAALPLSAQTAYEALFDKAGIKVPEDFERVSKEQNGKSLLVTGAAGGVGVYLVQLASAAGLHVTAATSSNERNAEFLRDLGADETIEYSDLKQREAMYDVIIDTVGGQTLIDCWKAIKAPGPLISVDSASYDFVDQHTKQGLNKPGVNALFFIVEGGQKALESLARFAEAGALKVFVLKSYPISQAREAYDYANGRLTGRGKVVVTV